MEIRATVAVTGGDPYARPMRVTRIGLGPLFPDEGSSRRRLIRRLRGIPLEILAFVLVTLLLPVLLILAAALDAALWVIRRKPWVGLRLVAFLWWFLFGEMQALAGILWIWIRSGGPFGGDSERRRLGIYNLRIHWARTHLAGIRVLFSLRFEVEDLALAGPGPVVIMIRHASIIDNTVPDALIAHAHGLGLRYVIKQELQMIPTIDIAGRWVPTNFVRRASGDTVGEVDRLRELARDLGAGEGILIYPEGTRQTDGQAGAGEAADRRIPARGRPARRAPPEPPATAPRRTARPARGDIGDRRRLLRARRVRRVRGGRRHLVGRPRRQDDLGALLALPGGRDPGRPRAADRLAVRELAAARRLGRRAPDPVDDGPQSPAHATKLADPQPRSA